MEAWKKLKADIDEMVEYTTLNPDPDVLDVFKYSISKGGAGLPHDYQMFSTWFYGAPDCTYITDWCYFLMTLAKDEEGYPVNELCKMVRFWFVQPSFFSNYCGLNKQYEFVSRFNEIMDTLDREAFVSVLDSLRCYIGNMAVWIYQYFPWGVGNAFPRRDKAYYEKGLALCETK